MLFYFSLGILILILGAQIILRFFKILETDKRESLFKRLFLTAVILIFIALFCQSCGQYLIWSQNKISKYFLPPYQSINYFIFYVGARFFAPYLISLMTALIFLYSAKMLNKKCGERFFYPEEFYFGALSMFLVGHPGWVFYSIILIIVYFILLFASHFLFSKKGGRLSLFWLWLPTAISVILVSEWIQTLLLWQVLKF